MSHYQSVVVVEACVVMPPPHRAEALSDDARLTSVYLSRTSGLSIGAGTIELAGHVPPQISDSGGTGGTTEFMWHL